MARFMWYWDHPSPRHQLKKKKKSWSPLTKLSGFANELVSICNQFDYMATTTSVNLWKAFTQHQKHLLKQQSLKSSIHIFRGLSTPLVQKFPNTMFTIRQMSSTLQNNNRSLSVHWIHGHKDFKGNELAYCVAQAEAKEMIGEKRLFEVLADI